LLLDSLKDHGSLTKQEIVRLLWDVLPDQLDDKQKMNKIEYLLKQLRLRGEIENQSKGKESIWMLGKS
jgi:ATP-dependent DNA helicase RecG